MPTLTRTTGNNIPKTFVPRFWESADQRYSAVRAIKARYEELVEHTGADSIQKQMLCQRAIFLATYLETMEVNAAEDGKLDMGVYTQAANALSGYLLKLGLDRKELPTTTLETYVAERSAK